MQKFAHLGGIPGRFNSPFLRDCKLSSRPLSRQPEVVGGGLFIGWITDTERACPSLNRTAEFCRGRRGFALSTVRPRERTRREHGGRKFRAAVTRKIAQRSGRIIPLCSRHIEHLRGSLVSYNTPFYFTVRYLHSFTPPSSLFLSILLSLSGVVYKISRASCTIPAIDCRPDTRRERLFRKSAKGSRRLCRLADIPSLGRMQILSRKADTASWLSCGCCCCCLSVSNSYFSKDRRRGR